MADKRPRWTTCDPQHGVQPSAQGK